jgi:hypothetical protein
MTDLATIADAADALCNPIRSVERIYERDKTHRNNKLTRVWTAILPCMLDQLDQAKFPGEVYMEDDGGGAKLVPRSIPPARLEAINASLRIQAGAAMWVLRVSLTVRQTTVSNIRALVGANTDSDTQAAILTDLRRWYSNAATLTGWIRPAWAPQAPCPLCGERSLRVRLDKETAACISCGEGWTTDTIGLLGAHIAAHSTVAERDTTELRRTAVLARRAEEAGRSGTEPRPDLPYMMA